MGAIDQYINLFRDNRDLLDSNGFEPANAMRVAASAKLEGKLLPRRGEENFENIDLEELLSPDFGVNIGQIDLGVNPEETFRCDVPVSSRSVLMTINGTFAASESAFDELPDGIDVGSLKEFGRLNPEEIAKYYGKAADLDNPLTALNTLLVQDGLYMRVHRGVHIEKPIQLVNILASRFPQLAARRILVIIEENASAKLSVCDHTQGTEANLAAIETIELFVAENARLDYYHVEESTENTTRLSTLYLRQQAGSQVTIDGLTLFNGTTRNEYYCKFDGEHAELKLYGMGIEDRERKVSTYSHINHSVPNCKSDELFKYTVDDKAIGSFTGRIYVAEGATGTEAYQASRNLVGNDGAKMYSKPQLEIYNDDVKCSHGCAIGQLDPLQLFYMRTRGLKEHTARQLLRQAFMADVLAVIDEPTLQDRLQLLTERRFSGLESACGKCGKCSQCKQS